MKSENPILYIAGLVFTLFSSFSDALYLITYHVSLFSFSCRKITLASVMPTAWCNHFRFGNLTHSSTAVYKIILLYMITTSIAAYIWIHAIMVRENKERNIWNCYSKVAVFKIYSSFVWSNWYPKVFCFYANQITWFHNFYYEWVLNFNVFWWNIS